MNLAKLAAGLARVVRPAPLPPSLAVRMHDNLASYTGAVTILLADKDRTAQIFTENWPAGDERIHRIASRSHSFAGEAEREWLTAQLLAALNG